MKKIISVKKGLNFNRKSNVSLIINEKKILLNDYIIEKIEIEEDDEIQLKYCWVKSKKINYNFFEDGSIYEITQLINKIDGLIFLFIFSFSIILFFITNSIWFSIPVLGVGIYIIVVTTCLAGRYLRLKKINKNEQ